MKSTSGSLANALNKSRKNGLARLKIIGSGDRSNSNQPPATAISVVELPEESNKRSPKPKTTDRRRSAGNYADHSTNEDRISSTTPTNITRKTTTTNPPIVIVSKPQKPSALSTNKAGVYYYRPTFLEQMKSLQCLRVLRSFYHKYGLKHVVLITVLLLYSLMGAGIFLFFEQPAEQIRLTSLHTKRKSFRRITVDRIISEIFNDTQRFLIFLSSEQTSEVENILMNSFEIHEDVVLNETFQHGVYSDMHWDFSNSMLYAWTIITTIGELKRHCL